MSKKINELLKQLAEDCQCGVQPEVGRPEGGNTAAALGEELSRKYYVAIAQILRDNQTKNEIAGKLANLFMADNRRFNGVQFMQAAGVDDSEITAWMDAPVNKDVAENSDAGFDAWMKKVDAEVQKISGMSSSDLGDVPYRDWYDDGVAFSRAARRVIKNAEMGESTDKKDAPKQYKANSYADRRAASELSRKYKQDEYDKWAASQKTAAPGGKVS